jgi:uncharacterized protein (TIGR03067 family)
MNRTAPILLAISVLVLGCGKTAKRNFEPPPEAEQKGAPGPNAPQAGPNAAQRDFEALVSRDREILQKGTWYRSSITVDNKTGKYIIPDRLTFRADGTLTDAADGKVIGTYTIDPTKTPKEIDLTTYEESRKGTYVVHTNPHFTQLRLCVGKTVNSPRPGVDGDALRAERAKVVDSGGKLQLPKEFADILEVELEFYTKLPPTPKK